ncbi:hypothetical protein [Sinorhizobium medicae]|uniref:hypothetical protein n=1 Tax=Sinorhizobium medicae TaxID=110321 RepID=UPI00042356F6|nr:hypothetical protein [Sinorhizobium medicae]RVQ76140.1 hypothetical protein CN244_06430 [Sinorhizobium medicae]
MTCGHSQASELADALYQRLRPYAGGGIHLAPAAVAAALKALLTIRAVAYEQEEENRILEHRLKARRDRVCNADPAKPCGGNVVRFPPRSRPLLPDGGDAA